MLQKHLIHANSLDFYSVDKTAFDKISLFEGSVPAGFPSPADDYIIIFYLLTRLFQLLIYILRYIIFIFAV